MLSLVDNRTYRRLAYRVLDHSPKATDISAFLKAFRKQLDDRGLIVRGITTDGSPLYPGPLALLFNGVPHQAGLLLPHQQGTDPFDPARGGQGPQRIEGQAAAHAARAAQE